MEEKAEFASLVYMNVMISLPLSLPGTG